MDKSLILSELKKHYGFAKDIDFAEFLGINQSTLSNWHKRGSVDYERIISKCELIDANWLFSGEGNMFRNIENNSIFNEPKEEYSKKEAAIEMKNEIIAGLKREISCLHRENELLRRIVDEADGKKKMG